MLKENYHSYYLAGETGGILVKRPSDTKSIWEVCNSILIRDRRPPNINRCNRSVLFGFGLEDQLDVSFLFSWPCRPKVQSLVAGISGLFRIGTRVTEANKCWGGGGDRAV